MLPDAIVDTGVTPHPLHTLILPSPNIQHTFASMLPDAIFDTGVTPHTGRISTLTSSLSPLIGSRTTILTTPSTTTTLQAPHRRSTKTDPHLHLRIAGVVGEHAENVNGIYKPVLRTSFEEMAPQAMLYVKMDDGGR